MCGGDYVRSDGSLFCVFKTVKLVQLSIINCKHSSPHSSPQQTQSPTQNLQSFAVCSKFGDLQMEQIFNILHGLKPAMLMVVVQMVFAGVNVLYKLSVSDGMSFQEEAKVNLDNTSSSILLGSVSQNLYVVAMALTSATFVSAMTNLIPSITFIVAITIGLEKVGFGTMAGKAKVLGTLIGLGGAMVFTFCKGFEIKFGSVHLDLLHHLHHAYAPSPGSHPSSVHHVLGALLALGSCTSYAIWLNIQTKMSEKYPCYYSSTALTCTMAAIQTTVVALCVEKDWSQWKLGWNIRLLTVAYSGILGSGLMISLISWCVCMRGPLYVSSFNPLLLVLVASAGAFFLEEKFYLGSIMGAMLIVVGLYVVLWGKGQETKKMKELGLSNNNGAIQVIVASRNDAATNISNNDNNALKQ
ncbi:hypothetical protein V6N11_074388 [Hibiscus sabdariffa]|uniref:WAT1-related protein n=1 Tax=Hibiscus sabdariffa TaxID=183260 RepID=A0ABR2R3F2_9ROSI